MNTTSLITSQRVSSAVFIAAILLATTLAGQNDWTIISTSGDPDPVTTISLDDPAGSETMIGFVATNFNRGMDYFADSSFYYYVSTDTLNQEGDRGLWSWVDGVNTQLATVDFSDASGGDASWDAATGRFYVVVDDGDNVNGDSLYVWENLDSTPTFAEIGEIGLTGIMGLAIDPTNGTLYAYDSVEEALYTIDSVTAQANLVGASGQSLSSVGSMDFSADGKTLVLAGGTSLYTVDAANGALTAIGTTLNVSAIAYNVFNDILLGDVNCDGEVNLLDVSPFVDAINSGEFNAKADINQDGAVNLLDVSFFVDLLAG